MERSGGCKPALGPARGTFDERECSLQHALNAAASGAEATGDVTFTISGDQLTIHVTAKGVSPDTEHWQHFHGFAEGDKDYHHFPLEEDYDSDPMDSYGLSKVINGSKTPS